MLTYKSYVFRIYPNKMQTELINKTIGCNRLVYNYYLNMKKELYENEEMSISCFEQIKDLKNLYIKYPFLKEIDSMSLRCALFNLDNAFKKMINEHAGYPKFKGKYTSSSTYRTNCVTSNYNGHEYSNIKVDLIKKTIKLPKLKEVKIKGYRNLKEIEGRIINATIRRDRTNKYYVAVLYEQNITVPVLEPNRIVGIDLGIKDIITTSDGLKIHNEKLIDKYEKRIKRKQRELSKKVKGSSNYYKTKLKIAVLYKKLSNAREHLIHSITNTIIKDNDIVVSETLKVKDVLQEKRLSKQIANVSFGEICRCLEYKTKLLGKKYIKINTYYPSSQICSVCGERNRETKNLSVRKWKCSNCNSNHDRDINASVNIMFEGLKIYMKELI